MYITANINANEMNEELTNHNDNTKCTTISKWTCGNKNFVLF